MFFPVPTETGYVVAHYSHALNGNVAVVDCATLAQASAIATRKNLEVARDRAQWQAEGMARVERRCVRECLPELVRAA